MQISKQASHRRRGVHHSHTKDETHDSARKKKAVDHDEADEVEVDSDEGCRGSDLESSGCEVDTGSECDAPSDSS